VVKFNWSLLDWPVFNLADLFVVSGTIALAYLLNSMYHELQRQEQYAQLQRLVEETVAAALAEPVDSQIKVPTGDGALSSAAPVPAVGSETADDVHA
jgi:hypothetical protein